jgi:hypothetical protein
MTVPFERTRALLQAKQFLKAMLDPKQTPKTPRWMRGKALALLRHYPGMWELELVNKALPDEFGPVPPSSALIVVPDDTHWVVTLKPEHVQKVMLRPVADGVYSVDSLDGHVPGVAIV